MKEKKKVKGGKRAGSGRKPSGRQKEAVTVYTDTSKFGGKEKTRAAIYGFLDGSQIPDQINKFLPSNHEIKQKVAKEEKRPIVTDLTKPTVVLEPRQQPKTNFSINTIPDQKPAPTATKAMIDAIKSEKIPKERDTAIGRKAWEMEQKKRIQEIENQLSKS